MDSEDDITVLCGWMEGLGKRSVFVSWLQGVGNSLNPKP